MLCAARFFIAIVAEWRISRNYGAAAAARARLAAHPQTVVFVARGRARAIRTIERVLIIFDSIESNPIAALCRKQFFLVIGFLIGNARHTNLRNVFVRLALPVLRDIVN